MSLLGLASEGSGPPVVWLHGFTQTRASAHSFRSILAGTRELLTIDLPGHGENADLGASLSETADLLDEVVPREPFTLAGYSLGGRVALHFALAQPRRLRALVLVSATLGIADATERDRRRQRDEALADHLEAIGAEAFLDEWLAQPMFADLPADPLERAARSRDARGMANSLRRSGTGTQAWLAPRARDLRVDTLVIAGQRDEKFVGEARLLGEAIAGARVITVPGVGHAAHLEAPEALANLVGSYPQ